MIFYAVTATHKIKRLTQKIRAVQGGTSASKTISIILYLIARAQSDKTPTLTSIISESTPHLKRGAIRDFKNIMQGHNYWNDRKWNATDFLYEFKQKVLCAFPHRTKSIALFGSRATGRAKKDSDYDVFIMVDKRDRNLVDAIFDIAYDIYIESNLKFDISPVIMSEGFFNARLLQERRIAREIAEQGIPL